MLIVDLHSRRIRVFDTTLRDGDQMPGIELSLEEKIEIAKLLDELGVDVLETGFPASSKIDFETTVRMAREVSTAKIAALARANPRDVEEAAASEAHIIHVFIATSDIHMKYKIKMSREQVVRRIEESVELVLEHGAEVLVSAEDATRSDPDFLVEFYNAAINAGARYINIPDTVGVATPWKMMDLVGYVVSRIPRGISVDVHCHNDFGMAVANTLAGVQAGADGVQVTVNGFGERAGNAALEEVVAALHFLMNVKTGIRIDMLTRVSEFISERFGVRLQPNKPVVGLNAFAHESGIHVHGVLSNPLTYEAIPPEAVGNRRRIVLGRHSGRHSVVWALRQLGFEPEQGLVEFILDRLKEAAPRIKKVGEETLLAWISEYGMQRSVASATGPGNSR